MVADDEDLAFWRRHMRIGVALSLVAALILFGYAVGTTDHPNRSTLAAVAVIVFLASPGLLAIPVDRVMRRPYGICVFYAWSAAVTVAISFTGALDGGVRSPIMLLFAITILFAGMAYPPAGVAVVSAVMVTAYTVVSLAVGDAPIALVATATSILSLFSVVATLTSMNVWHRRARRLQLTARLRELAWTDPLTQCLNRRAFAERIAASSGAHTAVCLIDLDGFKAVNDDHGHATGDALLVAVTTAMAKCLRHGDVLARIGGDEFAALLSDVTPEDAAGIAARMRESIAEAGAAGGVTASVGWACGEVADANLVAVADAAMYRAKAAGGDRVAPCVAA